MSARDNTGPDNLLKDIAEMMGKHVENWPNPKRVSTAIRLIDKTLSAAVEQNSSLLAACEFQENILSMDGDPAELIQQVREMRRAAIAKARSMTPLATSPDGEVM